TEIRSVTEVFRPSVIAQESKAVGVAPAHVDISGVVPALRGVLQHVNRTDRKADGAVGATGCWCNVNHIVRKNGVRHKTDARKWAARTDGPWPRRRIVDKVSALQVYSV